MLWLDNCWVVPNVPYILICQDNAVSLIGLQVLHECAGSLKTVHDKRVRINHFSFVLQFTLMSVNSRQSERVNLFTVLWWFVYIYYVQSGCTQLQWGHYVSIPLSVCPPYCLSVPIQKWTSPQGRQVRYTNAGDQMTVCGIQLAGFM